MTDRVQINPTIGEGIRFKVNGYAPTETTVRFPLDGPLDLSFKYYAGTSTEQGHVERHDNTVLQIWH